MAVINMSKKADNAMMWSPKQLLEDTISDIENEDIEIWSKCKKIVVIALYDEEEGSYDLSFKQAGMKVSEIISLLDISKSEFKKLMGF